MPLSVEERKRRKAERDRQYRAANKDRLKATKRAWQKANRQKLNAQARASYHENPEKWKVRQDRYVAKVCAETGEHPSTRRSRNKRSAEPDAVRAYSRRWAKESYDNSPEKAAIRRARFCLSQSMGVPARIIPKALIEAKAAQLLARRAIKTALDITAPKE